MTFRFSLKVCLICFVLMATFLRLSYWQWERHLEKEALRETLEQRVLQKPLENQDLFAEDIDSKDMYFRRISLKGSYDFAHEMVLRNRRHEGLPGVHVLTPLKLKDRDQAILVSRGFIPLEYSKSDKRDIFQKTSEGPYTGIIKESSTPHLLAPKDPEVQPDGPWVDAWLRTNVQKMAKQLPYEVLPYVVELLPPELQKENIAAEIMKSTHGKEELLVLSSRGIPDASAIGDLTQYPIHAFTTTLPPTRHLGYVYEWGFMALMTFCIGLLLQCKRPRRLQRATA